MGTFIGHVCPGLFLLVYGLCQAVMVSRAVITSSSLLHPIAPTRQQGRWARLWRISYGGWLKLVTGTLLVAYEISCVKGGLVLMNRELPPRFMYPKQWQHLTMFILLALNGCVDIASRNLLPRRCQVLEQAALVLTFYVLLLLLVTHSQDSAGVELQVHSLLILVVLLLTLVLTAELWAPATARLELIQTLLFLLMGSWLMQAGFILFRPITGYPWQDDDISDIMFVTTFFCWHVMADALCLLAVYGLCSFCHRSQGSKLTRSKEAPGYPSTSGGLYKLLQEMEQPDGEDQALLANSTP
ncbi:transmembrane epididymal protein 1A-like [Erinaceus europaeus]|uniref:Transmembrane epididymal protein 1A-like n=1 Tax=Erinaceus europaeus TaxID=9365 RepID=A0A1S2ZWZ7_ERIEU|nr:transmembrane epididymal protein 1A-like [Erinaceus europaeus]